MRRLLIRPGAIGDLIVSLPALEFLKADYTEVWVPGVSQGLVRFADRVRSIADTGLDLLELGLASDELRRQLAGFDDIVSWYGTARAEFREAVADLPFRFFPALPSGPEHASDTYLAQVGAPLGSNPRLDAGPLTRRFVALHPFSGSARKNWPLDRFQALAARIPGWPVEACAESETAFRFPDLWDLAQWLAGARLYIGNDSGITHLAAAVGVPVLALFGPTDPAVWAPRSARVLRRDSLFTLEVDEVFAAVIGCLECDR